MRYTAVIGWGMLLWLAAGVEAAMGCGPPGPLLLVAIACGLHAGMRAGSTLGVIAGFSAAALAGQHLLLFTLIGLVCGLGAGVLPRWLSRHHLLTGVLAAAALTLFLSFGVAILSGQPAGLSLRYAACQTGLNVLWMVPIYGIVLVVTMLRPTPATFPMEWE